MAGKLSRSAFSHQLLSHLKLRKLLHYDKLIRCIFHESSLVYICEYDQSRGCGTLGVNLWPCQKQRERRAWKLEWKCSWENIGFYQFFSTLLEIKHERETLDSWNEIAIYDISIRKFSNGLRTTFGKSSSFQFSKSFYIVALHFQQAFPINFKYKWTCLEPFSFTSLKYI